MVQKIPARQKNIIWRKINVNEKAIFEIQSIRAKISKNANQQTFTVSNTYDTTI